MYTVSLNSIKWNFKPTMLISLLALSMIAMSLPLGFNTPLSTSVPNVVKISPTLSSLIETQNGLPLNVIITTATSDYSVVIADIQRLGGQVKNEFQYVNALAASVPADKIQALAQNENVIKIYYDEPRPIASDIPYIPELDPKAEAVSAILEGYETVALSPEMISNIEPNNYWNPTAMGAEPVWDLGDLGQGSMVVVIDTGIWAGHFLFTGTSIIGGVDLSPDVGTPYEGWSSPANHWHGTHVAGIIASTGGIVVPEDDLLVQSIELYTGMTLPSAEPYGFPPGYKIIWLLGMAPFADLYAVKVFDHTGGAVATSYILAGMEYALNLKLVEGYDVDVISMSIGGANTYDGRDVEDQLVDYITSYGITMVVAAGNEGPAPMTVSSPGSANTAITVGAAATPVQTRVYWDYMYETLGIGYYLYTSETPQIYAFSSRGPTSDGRLKPTLAATGIVVLSAYHEANYPQEIAWASGTSMATPAVSGAVALLNTYAEYFIPGATPEDYKQALQNGAVWLDGYNEYDQGAGFLNVYDSLVALANDPSIGDVAAPLPHFAWLEDISNIPIWSVGTYETDIVDLAPGHKKDFVFRVTHFTGSIELEITNVELGLDLGLNSFEVYIQSAKRTTYAYFIDSANVWGDASFKITDYETTWTGEVTGVFYDEFTRLAPIEAGYVKIVIENDWTSFDNISAHIKIKAKPETCQPGYYKYFIKAGSLAEGENTGWMAIKIPKNTIKAEISLYWLRDWSFYPTSDLDLIIYWDEGYNIDGATLNSPERVILVNPTVLYVLIDGYSIYARNEPYVLTIKFTINPGGCWR